MKKELIEKCYDYINSVTNKQNKILPVKTLYGDGSRFENNFRVFESVYTNIKNYLEGTNSIKKSLIDWELYDKMKGTKFISTYLEKIAFETYPYEYGCSSITGMEYDSNEKARTGFIVGFKRAIKDAISDEDLF